MNPPPLPFMAILALITLVASAPGQTHFSTLYNFNDGVPAGLAVTEGGLNGAGLQGTGCGMVFQLTPRASGGEIWSETVLYNFADNNSDACSPFGGPVAGADGTLYGLSVVGGAYGQGAMYQLEPPASAGGTWAESVDYSFNAPDFPIGPALSTLIDGPDGSFYVLVDYAGGGLLQLQPPPGPAFTWSAELLFFPSTFMAGQDLIKGPHGEFYGSSTWGTPSNEAWGYVFELDPPGAPGGTWTCTVIHGFSSAEGGVGNPIALTLASDGTLYGVASGANSNGAEGYPAVFELTPPESPGASWGYTIIELFPHLVPNSQVLLLNGNLYGTAAGPSGGIVFELQPPASPGGQWTDTHLHHFTNGQIPYGLIADKDGTIYGLTGTVNSPAQGTGTVFKITTK
jgi:hypothetical protein